MKYIIEVRIRTHRLLFLNLHNIKLSLKLEEFTLNAELISGGELRN